MDFVVWQPCELGFLTNHLVFLFLLEIGLILEKGFPCNVFGICGCDCGVNYKFVQVILARVFCLPSV